MRKSCLFSSYLYNIVLELLARSIGQWTERDQWNTDRKKEGNE